MKSVLSGNRCSKAIKHLAKKAAVCILTLTVFTGTAAGPVLAAVPFSGDRKNIIETIMETIQPGLSSASIPELIRFAFTQKNLSETQKKYLKTVLYVFLAAASGVMQADGRAKSDADALEILLIDVIQKITGTTINKEEYTVDGFFVTAAGYLIDEKNEALLDSAASVVAEQIRNNENTAALEVLLKAFALSSDASLEECVKEVVRACVDGPKEGTLAFWLMKDGKDVRKIIYSQADELDTLLPGLGEVLAEEGGKPFRELSDLICSALLKETDQTSYASFREAAKKKFDEIVSALWPDLNKLFNMTLDFNKLTEIISSGGGISASTTGSLILKAMYDALEFELKVSSSVKPVKPKNKTEKAANKLTVKTKKLTAKANKKTVFSRKKAFKVQKTAGTLIFRQLTKKAKIHVSYKGKVTVRKGLTKGKTYKIKVKVRALGNSKYKDSSWKKVTLKVKIK